MGKDVSDFVGDCVSILNGEHTQSLRFQQHFVHHRHRELKGKMYIPSDRQVVSVLCEHWLSLYKDFLLAPDILD